MFTFSRILKAVSEVIPGATAEEVRYKINGFIREANTSLTEYVYGKYLLPNGTFSETYDSVADPGVLTTIPSLDNDLSDDDVITIYDSTSLDGDHTVDNQEDDAFDIADVFSATESGKWFKQITENYLDFPSEVQTIEQLFIDDTEVRLVSFTDYKSAGFSSNAYAFIDYHNRKVHFPEDLVASNTVIYNGKISFSEISDIGPTTEIDLPEKYFEAAWFHIIKELKLFGKHEDADRYAIYNEKYESAARLLKSSGGGFSSLKVW